MSQEDTDLQEVEREDLQAIGQGEIERVLTEQCTVYVGFAVGDQPYLIPLSYVWFDGSLCGLTSRGRKTRMAQANPRVSFQVDTSATTGHFVWSSVTGVGRFEVIEDNTLTEKIGDLVNGRFADAPDWLIANVEKLFAAGKMVAWQIKPTSMTGVKVTPPDEEQQLQTSAGRANTQRI